MAILLALLSALAYGISDFGAGVASRRSEAGVVSVIMLAIGLACGAIATAIDPGVGARPGALLWGAASGLGGGAGTLALYHGLAVGRMTVVATLSAVVAAVVPAIVGLATGDSLRGATLVGIVIAIPAIALVSWHSDASARSAARASVVHGLLAGLAFALLFIGLDRAGTRSGAWPLASSELVGLVVLVPFGVRAYARVGLPPNRDLTLIVGVGVIGGIAGLLFLAATGHGQLAIVAVVTSLYPAFTVLLARVFLAEQWSRTQVIGLGVAAAAIVLVSVG
ncbi:MAG: DMT family transporter [Solirubrobacteraceae bacterium]